MRRSAAPGSQNGGARQGLSRYSNKAMGKTPRARLEAARAASEEARAKALGKAVRDSRAAWYREYGPRELIWPPWKL